MDPSTALIYVTLPVLILVTYLMLCYAFSRKTTLHVSLIGLLVLTVLATITWYVVAWPLAYASAECCAGLAEEGRRYRDLFTWTMGLPMNMCYVFPDLRNVYGSTGCDVLSYLFLPTSLLILGLIPLTIARWSVNLQQKKNTHDC